MTTEFSDRSLAVATLFHVNAGPFGRNFAGQFAGHFGGLNWQTFILMRGGRCEEVVRSYDLASPAAMARLRTSYSDCLAFGTMGRFSLPSEPIGDLLEFVLPNVAPTAFVDLSAGHDLRYGVCVRARASESELAWDDKQRALMIAAQPSSFSARVVYAGGSLRQLKLPALQIPHLNAAASEPQPAALVAVLRSLGFRRTRSKPPMIVSPSGNVVEAHVDRPHRGRPGSVCYVAKSVSGFCEWPELACRCVECTREGAIAAVAAADDTLGVSPKWFGACESWQYAFPHGFTWR